MFAINQQIQVLHLSSVLDATARIRAYGVKDSPDSDSTLKETDSLEEMFRSLMVNEYGKAIQQRGGFGLAAQMKAQLLKHQEGAAQ